MRTRALSLLVLLSGVLLAVTAQAAPTLQAVKQRGYLKCGISHGLPGVSTPGPQGVWSGIAGDFCRAVAAAVFGAAGEVRFVPLSSKELFTALQPDEVALLSRNTTWTISRDTELGFE